MLRLFVWWADGWMGVEFGRYGEGPCEGEPTFPSFHTRSVVNSAAHLAYHGRIWN